MTIKDEAKEVLGQRKSWGSAWDEYLDTSQMDVLLGKTQRSWNLVEEFFSIWHQNKSAAKLDDYERRIKGELVDLYNYGNHLKEVLMGRDLTWLELSEIKHNEKTLRNLSVEWQHRLGMCDWAFNIVKCDNYSRAHMNPRSEHFAEIHCCDERTLIHEMLEANFYRLTFFNKKLFPTSEDTTTFEYGRKCDLWDMQKHIMIFQLVNALLKLKYGQVK